MRIQGVCFHDLEFDRLPVVFRSSQGTPYVRDIRVGMPRIPPIVLNSVFYLYENEADARAGENPGGTGFFINHCPNEFVYAVTNWHVAVANGNSVVRFNTEGGGVEILDLGPEDWEFIPRGDDLAVYPLRLDPSKLKVSAIPITLLLHEDKCGYPHIGVGEDAFMIGLFLDHAGTTTNIPSARFGNISMLPNPRALIEQPNEYKGESFVVDMHSRTGFSGSPVFAYRTFGSDLTINREHTINRLTILQEGHYNLPERTPIYEATATFESDNIFALIGIHWGQFPEKWPIKPGPEEFLLRDDHVEGVSGMTCVIPAWKIKAFLDHPKFKGPRDVRAQEIREKMNTRRPKPESSKKTGAPVAEAAPPATDENPTHREDFTRLVNAAARTRVQED